MFLTKLAPLYHRLFLSRIVPFFTIFSPKILTLCALITGVAILPALAYGHPFVAIVLLALSGFCDTLDGAVARATHRSSPTGAVLDITSDRCVECAVILGLYFVAPVSRALPCLLMLASVLICVTTFLVVGLFTPNESEKGFHYSPGLIERAEAFLFFGTMIFFPSVFMLLAVLFSFLVFLTAFIRIRQFLSTTP